MDFPPDRGKQSLRVPSLSMSVSFYHASSSIMFNPNIPSTDCSVSRFGWRRWSPTNCGRAQQMEGWDGRGSRGTAPGSWWVTVSYTWCMMRCFDGLLGLVVWRCSEDGLTGPCFAHKSYHSIVNFAVNIRSCFIPPIKNWTFSDSEFPKKVGTWYSSPPEIIDDGWWWIPWNPLISWPSPLSIFAEVGRPLHPRGLRGDLCGRSAAVSREQLWQLCPVANWGISRILRWGTCPLKSFKLKTIGVSGCQDQLFCHRWRKGSRCGKNINCAWVCDQASLT